MLLKKIIQLGLFSQLGLASFINYEPNKYLGVSGKRIETPSHQIIHSDANFIKRNHHHKIKSTGLLSTQLDFVRLGFYADVQIGSQNDHVKVLIDTGSSDFWIPSSKICDNLNEDGYNCTKFGSYDPSQSITFKPNNTEFFVSYGDGAISTGEFGQDSVIFNNVILNNVNIAVSNFTNTTSGILGIGYQSTESTNFNYGLNREPFNYTNFPQHLVNNKIINKSLYSLFLDHQGNAEILFGAIDHNQYQGSNLYGFPIVSMNPNDENYEITRIAITLNNISITNENEEYEISNGYIPVILDSGTTTAAFPYDVVIAISNLLGLDYDEEMDYFYGECNKVKNQYFKFNFQGIEFMSPVASYFLEVKDQNNYSKGCIFQVYMTSQEFIILGDSFLKDMYTTIDLEDNIVALAYKQNNSTSNIEVINSEIPNLVRPPKSETFGIGHSHFTHETQTITKPFQPTIPTLELNSAYATICITDEYEEYNYQKEFDKKDQFDEIEITQNYDTTTSISYSIQTTNTKSIPTSVNAADSLTKTNFSINIIAFIITFLM